MLTQKDVEEIGGILDQKLEKRLKFIPTKKDFFKRMDKLMGEVKAMREVFDLHLGQHKDINDTEDNHERRIMTIICLNTSLVHSKSAKPDECVEKCTL